ncbi:MAG: hypothetical protein II800_00730 [Lachnospiraceae bacterium]|nr:hypothetical protein [Lachnospiraceae bacterium]
MRKADWINSYLRRMDEELRRKLDAYGLDAEIRIVHRDDTPLPEEKRERYEQFLSAIGDDTLLDKIHERSQSWTEEITHYEKLINRLLERYLEEEEEKRFIGQIRFAGIHTRTPQTAPQITPDQLRTGLRESEERIRSTVMQQTGESAGKIDAAIRQQSDRIGEQIRSSSADQTELIGGLSGQVTALSKDVADGVEKISGELNAAYDSLTEELSDIKGSVRELAEQQAVFSEQLERIDEHLEGQIRDLAAEPEIEDLLQRKLAQIRELEQAYPAVSFEDGTRWLLLFIADRILREKLPLFLQEVTDGAYRAGAFAKEKDARGRDIYFAHGVLGEYGVQKKDGKAVIFHLEPGEEVLGSGLTAQFLATHPIASGPRIFYDQAIFDEFRRLLELATKSILIVSPWINLDVLGFYHGKEEPTEADYRDYWGGGYYRYFKNAADRKVEIVLKYGISDASGTKSENAIKEENTERAAKMLRKLLGAVVTLDHSNTHIKAVIIDERVCLIGSCNLLSFHSRYREGTKDSLRHELMTEIRDPEIIRNLTAYIRRSEVVSDPLIERKPV